MKIEKDFRAQFAMMSLHIWLCLRRLRDEGKDGKEMSQALYDIFWEDVERRVYAAGVRTMIVAAGWWRFLFCLFSNGPVWLSRFGDGLGYLRPEFDPEWRGFIGFGLIFGSAGLAIAMIAIGNHGNPSPQGVGVASAHQPAE